MYTPCFFSLAAVYTSEQKQWFCCPFHEVRCVNILFRVMVDARQGIPGVVLSQSWWLCIILYLLQCCQGRKRLTGTPSSSRYLSTTASLVAHRPFSHRAARLARRKAGRASHETDIRRPGDACPTKRFVSHRHPPLISPGLAPLPMSRPHGYEMSFWVFGAVSLLLPSFTPESDQQLWGAGRGGHASTGNK